MVYVLLACMLAVYLPPGLVLAADGEPPEVFFDDFNDGNADGWMTYGSADAGNRGAWNVNAVNQYAVAGNETGAPGTKAIAEGTHFADLVYEADFDVTGFNADSTGVLFRVTNVSGNAADGYNGYYVSIRMDRKVMLGRVNGEAGNQWKELAVADTAWTSGHLKVIAVGRHIQVFLNDMAAPVIDYVDNDSNAITDAGAIGLRTWWGKSTVDNVRVRTYSGSQTAAPAFNVPGGVYGSKQIVALSAAGEGAVIRYTLDGSMPDGGSPIYAAPIEIASNTVIKAYAEQAGAMASDIVTQQYVIASSSEALSDDFEGETAEGWELFKGLEPASAWTVAGGKLTAQKPRGDKAISVTDAVYDNFILEGLVNPYQSNQSSGFVFRASDPGDGADNMNGYFVGLNKNGYIEIGKFDSNANNGNGGWTAISRIAAAVKADTDNHLKIIGLGSQYFIHLNGVLVGDFTDAAYTSGKAGLRAWNDGNSVSYDQVRLYGLDLEIEEPPSPVATFAEDFEDGNADGWNTFGGAWGVSDGSYVLSSKGAGNKSVASETSFKNFTYEADLLIRNGTGNDNAGVIFRVSNPAAGADALQGYYAGITVNGRVQLGRMDNSWKELAAIPYAIKQNTVYRMKVVAEGQNIDVYIDGNHVISAVDRTFASGAVGVRAHFIEAVYDNLLVTDSGEVPLPVYDWSWVKGAVFVPTNAVNQIEQWSEYDHDINERELSYAATYGINFVRVFLHNLLWENESKQLLANLEDFLQLADKYGIKVEIVFFDDCWNDYPEYGPQLPPRYGAHNSRWVEAPGDAVKADYPVHKQALKEYVQGIVNAHLNDDRIAFWNIYNEPSNGESGLMNDVTKQIMNDARMWIKDTGTSLPVSSTGGQFSGEPTSDFITWHPYDASYPNPYGDRKDVLADELMNRLNQSVPGVIEHYYDKGVGIVMWELGIGRDNVRFPWGTDVNPMDSEPEMPFHGIVYPDGHPWSVDDVKALTGDAFATLPVFNVQYFGDDSFTDLVKTSIAPRIDFDLGDERGTGSPDASAGIGEDQFSIRWVGSIQPEFSEMYTIYADSDNVAKVWIGDAQVIDKTSNTREEAAGQIELEAGKTYTVKAEYAHAAGEASLHVKWSSPSMAKRVMLPVYAAKGVESVALSVDSLTMKTLESEKLTAIISPIDASNQQVTWSSDNPGVASVAADGTVTGVNKGTAVITATTVDGGFTASAVVTVHPGTTFKNPIVPVSSGAGSADPSITFKDGYYYYVKSDKDSSIIVAKSKRLQDIGAAPRVTVFDPPEGTMYSKEIWAPELQYVNGKWYIYFAADDGNNVNHRMYALESKTQDPQGEYEFKGKIADSTDKWAIDGAVLQKEDGSLYFVWSGWEGDVNVKQNLYIAPMSNPWTISGPRVLISTPEKPWELHGGTPTINEGPQPLVRDGKIFIVYSASGSWTDDYALGLLTNTDGDVLKPESWTKTGPVFQKAPTAYGTGHNNFTVSPDGQEDWLLYHAGENAGGSWANRSVRAQKLTWNEDGTPNFGTPAAFDAMLEQPSGTPDVVRAEYEAELAELGGAAAVLASNNASGDKTVGQLNEADADYVKFDVSVEEAGDYLLTVMAANGSGGGASASHNVLVNDGAPLAIEYPNYGRNNFNPSALLVNLKQGRNTITLTPNANSAEVDRIIVEKYEAEGEPEEIASISLDKQQLTIPAGQSAVVTATVLPRSAANKPMTLTSSDGSVVTAAVAGINPATGKVTLSLTAKAEGIATVTVASAGNAAVKAEAEVTAVGAPHEPDLTGYHVDHFDNASLNESWTIFQETADAWSLTKNPGFLTINTRETDLYQDNNSQNNVFLKDPGSRDFEIVAKVSAPIAQNHQQVGILVWENADNFVKAAHVWVNGHTVETAYETDRAYRKPGNYIAHPGGSTLTIKIKKMGNQYTSYIWDGYEWQQAADSFQTELETIKVGFYANNIVSGQRIDATIDYFAVRALEGGVELDRDAAALKVKETVQFTNSGASLNDVVWSSVNPAVAAVSGSGLVEALAPGRTVIKAVSKDGAYADSVVVTVEDSGQQPGVLFETGFEDPGAEGWSTYGGTWTAEDGVYQVTSGQGHKAAYDELQFTDYVLEADVQITSGTEAGLIFRASELAAGADSLEGYYVAVNAANKSAVLGEFTSGKWTEIASRKMPIAYNEWYTIKVAVNEGHIQVFVDDNPLNAHPFPKFDLIRDTHISTGHIGFRTWNADAKFDNLIVKPYTKQAEGDTYTNSVMPGIADPYVLFHDGTYYLYGTHTADWPTMQNGIKVYTSKDLANWEPHEGWALHNDDTWGNNRFWAPEVIEKDGIFYMYYAVEERLAVATSDSPLGPFVQDVQQPIHPDIPEIDAHIFTDDDGKQYMYFVRFEGGNVIYVAELNEDMKTIKEDTVTFVMRATQEWEQSNKAPKANINEGAFVIKHKDTYYLTYSGNHFESPDYGVGYATADSPMGPWTKYEYNPIMKSNIVVPGAGHHSLIHSPDGSELFMVYHTHHSVGQTEPRKLAIDRVQFVPNPLGAEYPDIMEVWGPTITPQAMPSAKKPPVDPPPTNYVPAPAESNVTITDGKAVAKLKAGETSVAVRASQLENHPLQVESGDAQIVIASELLNRLFGQLKSSMGAKVVVELTPVHEEAVVGAPAEDASAQISVSGQVLEITVKVVNDAGESVAAGNVSGGAQVTIPYEEGSDEELLAVYYYNEEAGQWQYVGGTVDASANTATVTLEHLSKYAVLEYAKSFADVPASHWAARTLQVLAAKRIVTGMSETAFTPNGQTTRAEFTALLARALGLPADGSELPFLDVEANAWYRDAVAAAYEAGIVNGTSGELFSPEAVITREQMAALLVRAYEYLSGEAIEGEAHAFKDADSISPWAAEEVNKAAAAGLLHGKGGGVFDPSSNTTRAQAAQAIYNLLQRQK